jgi:hypothetical protein
MSISSSIGVKSGSMSVARYATVNVFCVQHITECEPFTGDLLPRTTDGDYKISTLGRCLSSVDCEKGIVATDPLQKWGTVYWDRLPESSIGRLLSPTVGLRLFFAGCVAGARNDVR